MLYCSRDLLFIVFGELELHKEIIWRTKRCINEICYNAVHNIGIFLLLIDLKID